MNWTPIHRESASSPLVFPLNIVQNLPWEHSVSPRQFVWGALPPRRLLHTGKTRYGSSDGDASRFTPYVTMGRISGGSVYDE